MKVGTAITRISDIVREASLDDDVKIRNIFDVLSNTDQDDIAKTVGAECKAAEDRFRMSRLDIDAIKHTVFESPEYAKQLIDAAYIEFEKASIELHDLWDVEV